MSSLRNALDPRRSFPARVALAMALLAALGVAATTFVTSEIVRSTVTGRTGESFQAQADGLNDLVVLFLVEEASTLQALAGTDTIKQGVADRNASYAGTASEILGEIRGLDERWVSAADDDPLIAAVTSQTREINPSAAQLAVFLSSFAEHSEVFVTDRYGGTVGATGRLSDYYQADESWWQAAWNEGAGAVFISDPQFDESAGVTALLIAVPVLSNETGEVIGVLRSTLNVEQLRAVVDDVSIGRTGRALLLSRSGQSLFTPDSGGEAAPALSPQALQEFADKKNGFIAGPDTFMGYASIEDGARGGTATTAHSAAANAVTGLGWTVVIQQDSGEALAGIGLIVKGGIVVGAVVVLLATAGAFTLASAVTKPLVDLNRATKEISAGNLQTSLPPPSSDEIGQLAGSFRNMTTRLREVIESLRTNSVALASANEELEREVAERRRAERALRDGEAVLHATIESTADGILVVDHDWRVSYVNQRFLEMWRLPTELVEAGDAQQLLPLAARQVENPDTFAADTQKLLSSSEESLRTLFLQDGRVFEEFTVPLTVDGRNEGRVVSTRDVTEARRAEEALRESEAKYRHIFENVQDIFFQTELTGTILELSPAVEHFNYTREQLIGTSVLDIYADPDERTAFVQALLQQGEVVDYELRLKAGDGRVVNASASAYIRSGPDGAPLNIEGTLRDITERKQAEKALRQSESKFRTMSETLAAAAFIFQEGRIRYANAAAETITGYTREELHEVSFSDLVHPDVIELIGGKAGTHWHRSQKKIRQELKIIRKSGAERWIEFAGGPIEFEGRLAVLGTAFDVTDRKSAEEALRERARRDPLTGVLNHASIVDELRRLIASSSDGTQHAVAMVDVDDLKAVNDTYGHQVGDALLESVARALSKEGAVVGRYGGDEFVAILQGGDRTAAERYRRDVSAALEDSSVSDPESGAKVPLAISIGLAIYPDEANTVADLVKLSDGAMYAAKRQRLALSGSGPSGADRAAEMVGQMVPFLTSADDLSEKLRLMSSRLSASGEYDAVDVSLFADAPGAPVAQNVAAMGPQDLLHAWNRQQRQDDPEPHPIRRLFAKSTRPVILDDPWHDDLLLEGQRTILRQAGLRSVLVVPMVWQAEVIGSLGVARYREAAFTSGDAQTLATVAAQVTAIVRMATLVDELQSTSARLSQAHEESVLLLAAAAEAHDRTTGLHLQGVRALAEALARELGHSEDDATALGLAAVLHDIGKIRVPEAVLATSGRLADYDWEMMKRHTTWGQEFLASRPGFEVAAGVAFCHHEHWDGSGYPRGLAEEAIPEAATVVAVADAFDAMTHDRPYRAARSVEHAVEEIAAHSGRQFSPRVVDALVRLHKRGALPVTRADPGDQAAAA